MDGLTLCVPSSVVREAEDQREATRKLGYVARAAAVFSATRLVVFPDGEGERRWGGEFVATVLRYAATPPDLRSGIWDRRDELAYVGVLPPLRLPSRTGSTPDGDESKTQGLVTEVGPDGRVRVNSPPWEHPISLLVPSGMELERGERVTIRISSREPVRARITGKPEDGFQVVGADLPEVLADGGYAIATSRHGERLSVSRLGELVGTVADVDDPIVAFGSPGRGLPEMLGVEPEAVRAAKGGPVEPDPGFDLWVNTIPNQGSQVVRTEEAMFASLASLTLTE
ncbi:putative RNA uridine N3 methyltransferase [Halopenitus salinus]|uniref:RNA uridine N3 methyltransferase n=1 Tax=Halopenitus salinus TaxID=1198295 RepID=A0ABD5UTX3_9EURY